ncbi:hypothetical protein L0Z72_04425 [candidate division KSB1 bacterium]|nr:hypothetical protein [candidate division KSB1 bacterium]
MQPLKAFLEKMLGSSSKTEKINYSQKDLVQIWTELFDREEGYDKFEAGFLTTVQPEILTHELAFRSKGWILKINEALLKTGITTALLTTLLYLGGYNMLPALVLPSIIPIIFDLERVQLKSSEKEILVQLFLNKKVSKKFNTPDELYEMLPEVIREQLSRLDFLDFIEKLKQAGHADEKEDKIKIYPIGKGKWRISFI